MLDKVDLDTPNLWVRHVDRSYLMVARISNVRYRPSLVIPSANPLLVCVIDDNALPANRWKWFSPEELELMENL